MFLTPVVVLGPTILLQCCLLAVCGSARPTKSATAKKKQKFQVRVVISVILKLRVCSWLF
jgi:hypothetical protein